MTRHDAERNCNPEPSSGLERTIRQAAEQRHEESRERQGTLVADGSEPRARQRRVATEPRRDGMSRFVNPHREEAHDSGHGRNGNPGEEQGAGERHRARHGGRAVHRGEHADVVARSDLAVGAAVALEGGLLRQGEDVLIYGFPLRGVLSSSGQLGAGMVTALSGLRDNPLQVQIDVPVQAAKTALAPTVAMPRPPRTPRIPRLARSKVSRPIPAPATIMVREDAMRMVRKSGNRFFD